MGDFLSYLDTNPIGATIWITVFIALIISNVISIKNFLKIKRNSNEPLKNVAIGKNINVRDIDTVKTVIYQVYNNFLEKEYTIEREYNQEIESVGKNTVYNVVQNIVINYGKSIDETVDTEEELFKDQDLLELYLTRDLNKVVLSKLEYLYDSSSIQKSDDFELNNKIETVSREIIDSLILGIKGYGLLTDSLTYLEKTLESSSRPLFDEIRKSIKSYVELNKNKQKEKLELVKTRNEIIDKQILLLIGDA